MEFDGGQMGSDRNQSSSHSNKLPLQGSQVLPFFHTLSSPLSEKCYFYDRANTNGSVLAIPHSWKKNNAFTTDDNWCRSDDGCCYSMLDTISTGNLCLIMKAILVNRKTGVLFTSTRMPCARAKNKGHGSKDMLEKRKWFQDGNSPKEGSLECRCAHTPSINLITREKTH